MGTGEDRKWVSLIWGELKAIVEVVEGLTDETPIIDIDCEFFRRREGRPLNVSARLCDGGLVVD